MRTDKTTQLLSPEELQILVCCHKECALPESPYFLPIQVGAALASTQLNMQRDNELNGEPCENISELNRSFCELTAIYWAWKHIRTAYPKLRYIGLNHYRRFFAFEKIRSVHNLFRLPEAEAHQYRFDPQACSQILASGKDICAKKIHYPYPVAVHYSYSHMSEDLRTLRQVIADVAPEYEAPYIELMGMTNTQANYNMFVMPVDEFEHYAEWLFSILLEANRRMDISAYNTMQARVYGYMAESLLNLWWHAHKLRPAEVPVYKYADNQPAQNSTLKQWGIELRSAIGFACTKPRNNPRNFFEQG